MRVDVVTIFPEYLQPLALSMMGRAQRIGALDLHVHDLRDATTDRHRTVDDTPFGGGAGMVMTPEPWALTLERVATEGAVAGASRPRLLVPSPSGQVLDHQVATALAAEEWLVLACGRYEGIDERVLDWARDSYRVTPISIGDYVLCGGEVAALVVCEAVVRLLPGVLGNPASLDEESHTGGLLEYPVYTKPASWRDRDVPSVLLSGDHGAIAAWRDAARLQRTVARRPDLLRPSSAVLSGLPAGAVVRGGEPGDAGELLTLQRACWLDEALANPGVDVPAVTEDLDDVVAGLRDWHTRVVRLDGRLIGAVRGRSDGDVFHVGRLMVVPDLQGRGIGRALLELAETLAPAGTESFELLTGAGSSRNQRMYRKAGYREVPAETVAGPTRPAGVILLHKRVRH